ncbi:MAG: molybdopterin oxidoreductase family protein [Pseudomonadota bacterium]
MTINPFETAREDVDCTPDVADEVKTTTCYMCACRCGIRVYLRDGTVRYIDGNPNHPVNKGVICGKGSAGIMTQYSPARLTKPLKRIGPRGSGEFAEIEWDEALALATEWLGNVRRTDPKRLAFFTGRDQSQSLTGWWAGQFGTPNFAAHGGFCSVNMAAGGLYSIGGSFWEFGEPDWEHTKYFMLFGVAEDHDSNPIKTGLGKLKTRSGTKVVSVNPVQTGYSAIADEWVGIRPGTDGLFILSLIRELLLADAVDLDYLVRYTNAPWLVIDDPEAPDHGLFARGEDGEPLAYDRTGNTLVSAMRADIQPMLVGEHALPDGRVGVPVFQRLVEHCLDEAYAPEAVAAQTGIEADAIRRIAAELADVAFSQSVTINQKWTDWAGREHDTMVGRPVSFHAMRGISAHSNGFHTCRALHLLQIILGSVDVPGGWRYKAPFPKPIPPGPKPAGKTVAPETGIGGMPLGFVKTPDDLIVNDDGTPIRIDKGYSWEYPISAHGLMHVVLHNAWAGDPYPIDVLFMYMANMAWNSAMNVPDTLKYLTDKAEDGSYKIPKVIYSDAYYSETVPYADLVLPDTTYLERWDCISLLDRPISSAHGPADAIRQPVVAPDRDVRAFQDVLIDLGGRLGLPGFVNDDGAAKFPGGYPDYIVNHERSPGIGPLAGWRGDGDRHGTGPANPKQLDSYVENGCFWQDAFPDEALYFKHANRAYLDYAQRMGWMPKADPIVFQIYSEDLQRFRLAAQGHGERQPPDALRERIRTYFDPLPIWYVPFEEAEVETETYPLHALTQRPMHMYHSWGSQNAWLRQITNTNHLYVHADLARDLGLKDDDWVWVESHHGRVKAPIRTMTGVNRHTVWTWNAIGKRRGAWGLDEDAPEAKTGFLLNHVISDLLPERGGGYRYANADPVTGQAAWYDLRVRLQKCARSEIGETDPRPEAVQTRRTNEVQPDVLRFGQKIHDRRTGAPALPHKEWIAHRNETAETVDGIAPGHGNAALEGQADGAEGTGGT